MNEGQVLGARLQLGHGRHQRPPKLRWRR